MPSVASRHVSASCLSSPVTRSFDRSRAASSNMIKCARRRSTIILRFTMIGRLAETRRKKLGQKRGWLRLSRQIFSFHEPDLCPLPRVTRSSLKGRSLLPPSRKPTGDQQDYTDRAGQHAVLGADTHQPSFVSREKGR